MNTEKTILQNKVENLLVKNWEQNEATLNKITYDNESLEDFIIPLGKESVLNFESNGTVKMIYEDNYFTMHHNALGQLGDKYGIPRKYIYSLSETEWGRDLLRYIFNDHTANINRDRILLRVVDNEARAVLSDRYRRLNSESIYNEFIEQCGNNGAVIYDSLYTPTKSYLSAIIPTVFEINTENNGLIHSVFGARLANSDYGDGALDVRAFQMNVVCLNGMVSETMLKQIHLGKRLPQSINFSERTYQLDTQAMASAISDITKNVLSEENIMKNASKVKEASSSLINIDNELQKLPRMGFLKDEIKSIETKLMENDEEQGLVGKATKWKLSQAVTAVSNDIGDRRKRELNELAGKLISL